jgi:hypothetical protein
MLVTGYGLNGAEDAALTTPCLCIALYRMLYPIFTIHVSHISDMQPAFVGRLAASVLHVLLGE